MLSHQWPGARMGGIGSAVRSNAQALAASGHDVHVFTLALPDDARGQIQSGVTVHETPDVARRVQSELLSGSLAAALNAGGEGTYRLSIASLLSAAFLECHVEQPFDVVEAPEVEALALPLSLMAELGVPVITHLHCCTALARTANGQAFPASDELAAALEFAAIHLAEGICAPTGAVVKGTRQLVPIRQDVRIIPHAFVSPAQGRTAPPAAGSILFVGRIEKLKGVERIASALNLFLPRHPAARFCFAGPDATTEKFGSMRRWIECQLHSDIRSRVEFTGELSPAQVALEWQRCSFGVLPSLCENFSMACCEGMAAGRPLIVGAGTGSVELAGRAGIIIDSAQELAEAMELLWTDQDRREQLGRAAYARISELCAPQRVSRDRARFYQECIARFKDRSSLPERLEALPPRVIRAVLPALCSITANLSGVRFARSQTPGQRLLGIMEEFSKPQGRPAKVLLYGAGKHTARLLTERQLWECRRHRVVGIIDDHPRFAQTPVHLGLPVQSMEGATARVLSGELLPPVVLSTDTYQEQFWRQSAPLRDAGVPVRRLYS